MSEIEIALWLVYARTCVAKQGQRVRVRAGMRVTSCEYPWERRLRHLWVMDHTDLPERDLVRGVDNVLAKVGGDLEFRQDQPIDCQ